MAQKLFVFLFAVCLSAGAAITPCDARRLRLEAVRFTPAAARRA